MSIDDRLRADGAAWRDAAQATRQVNDPTGRSEGRAEIGSIASDIVAVRPAGDRRRWRLGRWAPLTAAAVVAVAAVGLSVGLTHIGHPAATGQPGQGVSDQGVSDQGVSELVGIVWNLDSIDGQSRGSGLGLSIEPNGRFEQYLFGCGSVLRGQLTIEGSHLTITSAQVGGDGAGCPLVPRATPQSRLEVARLQALFTGQLFTGHLSATVQGGQLVLRNAGGTAATYTRAASSPARTRQWAYHGLGISLPAGWPASAVRCGTPSTNTVIVSGSSGQCHVRRPRVTSVQFGPYNPGFDPFATPPLGGGGYVIDGVVATYHETGPSETPQVAEVQIRRLDVSVIIISPSRTDVDNLTRQLYLTTS